MKTHGPTMRMNLTSDCVSKHVTVDDVLHAIRGLEKQIARKPRGSAADSEVFGVSRERETAALAALNDAHRRHYGRPAPRTWGRA